MSVSLTLGVESSASHRRVTPPPGERRFAEALAESVTTLGRLTASVAGVPELAAARTATAAVAPGAVSSSLGALEVAGPPGSAGAEAAGGPSAPIDALGLGQDTLYYLRLQERISAESRHYAMASNVMKARHDTAKTCINNIG